MVGITCARHSTFKRDGIVDLHVGERCVYLYLTLFFFSPLVSYANTDYALYGTLRNLALVKHIVLTYDIACQYSISLVERFRKAAADGIFPSFILSAVE